MRFFVSSGLFVRDSFEPQQMELLTPQAQCHCPSMVCSGSTRPNTLYVAVIEVPLFGHLKPRSPVRTPLPQANVPTNPLTDLTCCKGPQQQLLFCILCKGQEGEGGERGIRDPQDPRTVRSGPGLV